MIIRFAFYHSVFRIPYSALWPEAPMPLVPLRKVLDHAAANGYGVAAFNVNNMEQIQAIMEAAKETDSPVIVQASRGARRDQVLGSTDTSPKRK